MEEKKVSFSVQMTVRELYRFIMYHAYHKFSGVLGIVLSIAACIVLAVSFGELGEQTKAVLILVAVWFIIVDPIMFYSRARGQVKRNKVYQKPLDYVADGMGITISQGEQKQTVEWKQFVKIVETKQQFLVYSNPMYAFIFPKSGLGDGCADELRELILESTKNTHVRLKGLLKNGSYK